MGLEFSEKLDYSPSYNIAPSQNALVTTADDPQGAELMHFGFDPFYYTLSFTTTTLNDRQLAYGMLAGWLFVSGCFFYSSKKLSNPFLLSPDFNSSSIFESIIKFFIDYLLVGSGLYSPSTNSL